MSELVCELCHAPIYWTKEEQVWRHVEPQFPPAVFCDRYGYPTHPTPTPERVDTGVGKEIREFAKELAWLCESEDDDHIDWVAGRLASFAAEQRRKALEDAAKVECLLCAGKTPKYITAKEAVAQLAPYEHLYAHELSDQFDNHWTMPCEASAIHVLRRLATEPVDRGESK